ncbi:methylcobamide--CoM methyltransferase [Paenibacillus antibioticophila]|uniref:Methylcobamide--CoM methyltransferase n=1 Tax=Paenibacillus antibioticophila TaxID=1274374 RepID=A0A920CGF2_9BACL|nr:uroporphyrinogen decarboxylase family protein [Paenibacillus antibioticophila]GIO38650.1 methylcobamide--CoM methyltransferase [Paenibacillus antibioticophila]
MTKWSKRERFNRILRERDVADRPMVSAWRHFIEVEHDSIALAAATVDFQRKYDWDFVKINPRTTYYAEVWGNEYDYSQYDGVVPLVTKIRIQDREDLKQITPRTAEAAPLQDQLKVISRVRQELGDEVPIVQTVFSPLAVLEYLGGHRTLASYRPAIRKASPLPELLAASPTEVHKALEAITETLVDYAKAALRSGADGFFYAVLGLARDGYLTSEEYKEFGLPYDLELLRYISPDPVILHTCGPEAHPERFAEYPISALHWADRAPGNPSLAGHEQWLKAPIAVGGVDERLFGANGSPSTIISQSLETIEAFRGRPLILAPGCGLPLDAEDEQLKALRNSVEHSSVG